MGPLGHSAAAATALLALPVGLVGAALKPSLRVGWRERLGLGERRAPGAIWVHCASVGEAQAALGLIAALEARGERVVASTMTATGRALLRQRRPDLPSALAPLDHPWSVAAALRRVQPAALVFVETELWPSWILGARDAGIPVVVVSARLSDRSFPRYQRAAWLLRPVLTSLAAVGARSPGDAERFRALGVPVDRVEVTGDLKLEAPPEAPGLGSALAERLGKSPLFVAGSTHEGEETAALEALAAAESAGHGLALVLAPRHPERFDAVVAEARASGRRVVRRSDEAAAPLEAGDVLVLDSVGELGALWSRAAVGFVGGSLVDRGGHNLIEPARAGRAPIFGPHVANTRAAAGRLLAADAGRQVADARGLSDAVGAALADAASEAARGARAAACFAAMPGPDSAATGDPARAAAREPASGTTERSVALIARVLPSASHGGPR